jgi:ribosomal protein L11 methyltransferase
MSPAGRNVTQRYVRVGFDIPAAMADEAAGMLIARGALGCAVDGDTRAALLDTTVTLDAYFRRISALELNSMRRAMAAAGMLAQSARAPVREQIVDPGWATAWKERFRPLKVGRRLIIVPPWSGANADARMRIVINPGQAFGTGHHPTTHGALKALEELCTTHRFGRGLDVGTGSGILAIAMRLFCVPQVDAIDVDSVAIDNARENAALNSLDGTIRFSTVAVDRLRQRFDVIAANILGSTLIAMAGVLPRLLAKGGRLVLGGILDRQAREVLRNYHPPMRRVRTLHDRGWTTLVLAR